MSPRHAIAFTFLIAILLPFYYYVDRPPAPVARPSAKNGSLLKLSGIESVSLTRGDITIRYRKASDGERYQLVQPVGKFVPQGLMQALASALTKAKPVEVVATNSADLAQFGLNNPRAEISVTSEGRAKPIDIYFGDDNPTGSAVYARVAGVPDVILLGKNLEYYENLMFESVGGGQGERANSPSP